jgi:hypothetical protein
MIVTLLPRTAHARIVERKTERPHQMQLSTRVGAKPNYVAGVRWNLRVDEDDGDHGSTSSS